LARPGQKVISISGDGGFLFSAAELETAVREKMDFVHIVWVDGYYDMVKEQQLIKYKRDSAVKLGYVDIVKFAESFGAIGYRIQSAAELLPTLKKALEQKGPVLIEVPIDYSDNPKLFESVNVELGG
jgi:acetolactate synthase I/II/III large subunit